MLSSLLLSVSFGQLPPTWTPSGIPEFNQYVLNEDTDLILSLYGGRSLSRPSVLLVVEFPDPLMGELFQVDSRASIHYVVSPVQKLVYLGIQWQKKDSWKLSTNGHLKSWQCPLTALRLH